MKKYTSIIFFILFFIKANLAFAVESYLCVPTMITGFKVNRYNKTWIPAMFHAQEKMLLKKQRPAGNGLKLVKNTADLVGK